MNPDRAKITKGLQCCAVLFDCTKCPYYKLHDGHDTCVRNLMLDVLKVISPNPEPNSNITEDVPVDIEVILL